MIRCTITFSRDHNHSLLGEQGLQHFRRQPQIDSTHPGFKPRHTQCNPSVLTNIPSSHVFNLDMIFSRISDLGVTKSVFTNNLENGESFNLSILWHTPQLHHQIGYLHYPHQLGLTSFHFKVLYRSSYYV